MASKEQPHNPSAERIVVQAAVSREFWDNLRDTITSPEMILHPRYRAMWRAISQLHASGRGVDPIAIATEAVRDSSCTVPINAESIRAELDDYDSEILNHEDHAIEVRDQWVKRQIIEISVEARGEAAKPATAGSDLLDALQARIGHLAEGETRGRICTPQEMRDAAVAMLIRRYEAASKADGVTGLPTGIRSVDGFTRGFARPRYSVIGARPSLGKSSLLKSIHKNLAEAKIPSALFTWEEDKDTMYVSIAAMIADVDSELAVQGGLLGMDVDKLTIALNKLAELPLVIINAHDMDRYDIRAYARRLKREMNVQMISADYLQQMLASKRRSDRQREARWEIADNSKALVNLSKELDLWVIAAAQLNRDADSRPTKEPWLKDLRECGNIEQDADDVILIHRPEYYDEEYFDGDPLYPCTNRARLLIPKRRGGRVRPKGIEVAFTAYRAEFHDTDPDPNASQTLQEPAHARGW